MTTFQILWLASILDTIGIGFLLWKLPALQRREVFFSVTVPGEFAASPAGSAVAGAYQRRVLVQVGAALAAVVACGLAGLRLNPEAAGKLMLAAIVGVPLALLAGSIRAYSKARAQVSPHSVCPTPVREAALLRPPSETPGIGLYLILFGPYLLIAGTAFLLWLFWDRIPERYPTHWGASGKVDGWSVRTPSGVGGPLVIAVILDTFLLVLGLTMTRVIRHIYATGEAARHEARARRYMLALMGLVCWFLTAILCATTLYLPLRHNSPAQPGGLLVVSLIGNFLLLAAVAVIMGRISQCNEDARKAAAASGAGVTGDRTADRCWKWGMIYNNPDDPAVWVEKRFGVGWTINTAHPQGWAWIAGILALPLLIILVISLLARG